MRGLRPRNQTPVGRSVALVNSNEQITQSLLQKQLALCDMLIDAVDRPTPLCFGSAVRTIVSNAAVALDTKGYK
jgi:hypothetical protein